MMIGAGGESGRTEIGGKDIGDKDEREEGIFDDEEEEAIELQL